MQELEIQDRDSAYLIADLPADERPREKLLQHGSGILSLTELLAIILKTGPRGCSTIELARQLLDTFDRDLNQLAGATPTELAAIKGIGPAKAAELRACFEIASRLKEHAAPHRPILSEPADAAEYFRDRFRGKKQEELHVVLLTPKNHVIRDHLVTVGLVDRSQVHAREVFRPAIQHAASKLLLAHNHPSGDPTPSKADIACTRELVQAGKILRIEVVDHVIVGTRTRERPREYHSLREAGHID